MKRKTFIQSLLFSSGGIFVLPTHLNGMKLIAESTTIHMIYNNTGRSQHLKTAWGLSVWIETKNGAILFDTGGKGSILMENIQNLDIDITRLNAVVISHRHWDHKNGLKTVLEKTNYKPAVFVVENDLDEFRKNFPEANIMNVKEPTEIDTGCWSTGQLNQSASGDGIDEQSLILVQNDATVVLTGCSHPGIVNIVKETRKIFPSKSIELVAGGFHLLQKKEHEIKQIAEELFALDVNRIAPSHCTGDKAIEYFRKTWGNRFIDFNIGDKQVV